MAAAAPYAGRLVWPCDPMHGNTVRHASGLKTRVMADMRAEVERFFAVLRAGGAVPGGLHLEMTPDDVTECVDDHRALRDPLALPRYASTCDPRLTTAQAESLLEAALACLPRTTSEAVPDVPAASRTARPAALPGKDTAS
ncbi:3-deoxy-7-phosphoheptulonate synthase [Streptomyces sp. TS71-3]|uniref:3-deoxy-7-phosphoheptulonate synthase n=1 Tax=Streptomyces sp. TS71-3 TaxID=2733862 RepID=UPI001B2E9860|nr:3-deoxy-7-phosphoheptulonate synthase [Streptomyces sp. TS71-3]GHJ42336.1 hypothetical protein Sm713_79450 [Streptomyces sp. TS71-3]